MLIGIGHRKQSGKDLAAKIIIVEEVRKIYFPEGSIKYQLSNFDFVFTRTGVKYSAPSGLHDDSVCALALAWAEFQVSGRGGAYSFSYT